MFKRANKITALLVAAAAVVSLVPATGVNAADVKRIESEDGTVYNAVAYKDGKVLIDGEIDGKDEGVYFLNNGKYTELEDLDTGSEYGIYGEKYATVDTDDYYVDLTSGKVTDDEVADDDKDDAASALRKKVRKDDDGRFISTNATGTGYEDVPTLTAIPGAKFGETWYETSYQLEDKSTSTAVYTDAKGAYIDADYNVGKIRIKTTDGAVTLENTVDTEDLNTKGNKASVKVSDAKVLGHDKNYIYRAVNVTIKSDAKVTEVNGLDLYDKNGDRVANGITVNNETEVSFRAIQKISKAQDSDDIDGIKFAKTVNTYALTEDDGDKYDTKYTALVNSGNAVISDGKIIVYENNGNTVDAAAISLKTKAGFGYTDITDGAFGEDTEGTNAFDVDVDGNLWKLDSGNLYKFNNDDDWDKVYKVDGAMTDLSIYDKNNFVIWNEDDEVYSVVGGKTTDSEDTTTPEVKVGWVQNADGTWIYNKEDGTKATGWLNLNGTWYYLKADGIMATGWVLDGATWYYTNASGAMQTGWINVNGTWYYTNASGAMQTGWINDNGTWYYCNASGAMLANTTVDGYVLGANGAWVR